MASFAEWSNKKKKEREESQNASTLGKETSQGPSASKPASFGEWSNQKKGITYVYDGKHYATERDARQAMTANAANKPVSDKASAGTDRQQTADKRPVTINRPSSINRYMSTDRRNTLHQAAMEEAKAQAKLDSAKRVQAQRSGLRERQAYNNRYSEDDRAIGRYGAGNIDLYNRPQYRNEDGSISTVDSIGFNIDGQEVLLPSVWIKDGKPYHSYDDEEILNHYRETGEYLGKFNTLEEANAYGEKLHRAQEYYYSEQHLQSLPAEKNTEESATLAHRTAGLRGPVDPEQAARNEAVRLAEDQALRDAYRETYGEEAPEKSVWNQIKLASAANLSGLTKAGQGLINTADFVVNLIPRTLEDTGLVKDATDNPVSNAMRKLVEMGQRDAETWDREVAKYSAAQGTTAGKIAGFQEQVMQNVPQTVIKLMEFFATGGASAAASLGAPVQGVLPMVQKAVKELAKKPDFWYSFITELGNNYQEALNQGADNDRATVAALTASLANAVIDVGGDTGEGGLETLLQKIGGGQGAMVSWLLSLPEEGMEEVLQGITTRATNAAMFKGDTPLYGQGGIFDKEAAKEEFGSGMAVAAVLGGAQIGANALYNKVGSAIRNKQLGSNTDPVMEQAMQMLQEKMGTENAPVLPTQSAQETIERTDDKTVTRQSNPVLKLLEKGSASAETLAAKSKGDEGFWNQVDELVNSGQASFDEGGNLYLVNAEDHIDNRTSEYVGNQQVKSFQYLHPELHEYYAKAAQGLLNDLEGSTKASRYQTVETGVGMDTKWQGERRITVEPIARLLDNYGFTYAEVKQGLEDIIQNHGSENYAKAKRLEMVLDDIMTEGYTDIDGMQVESNQAYIQAKAGIAGAADQYVTDASPDVPDAAGAPAITRDAQTIANDVYRVNRAAAALGENGSKALSAVYGNDEISSRYTPEEIVQGFYEVYNEAMTGKAMSEEAKNRAAALPENVRYMAESSGKEDARRAKQAKYFGKDSKLVRDSNWKKANLSSKTTRKLDALANVLGVQIKFVEQVDGGQSSGSYQNGVISIALDSESPVMTVAIHEAVHRLREASPGSYAQLAEFVRQNMNEQQWLANFVVDRNDYGTDKSLDYLNEEIVADAFGTILNDSGLLEQFAKEHTNILQRMADSIRDIMRSIRKAASMEELKLSRSEKAAFSSLADELRGMERAMRSALKAVEKTGSQAYNVTNETKFSRKGSQNGREENRGNEETGRQEGSDTGGRSQVQGTVQRVSGRAGLVLSAQEASKGQRPAVAFNESDVVEPVEGSVVYGEMQIVHSYDVPCFAVSDSVWDEYWKDEGSIPAAFSDKGQVFFRETLSEDQRVKTAYHELTHIMKEVMYQPYIDFISRTMNHLNQQSVFTRQILERAAKSRGIVLNPNMKTADILDWYDEFHAGIYGDIAANNTDDVRWLLDQVFRDFDAYAAELTELHRQFKDSRTGEKFKMKRAREDGKNLIALHNLSAEKLQETLQLGGFPMPSIAIVKDDMGHEKFGDISVLFRKDTISPTDRRNHVYGGDAWTPTRPAIGYKVNEKVLDKMEKRVEGLLGGRDLMRAYRLMLDDDNAKDALTRWDGDFKRAYGNNEALKIAYLKDSGVDFKPVMKDHAYTHHVDNIVLRRVSRALGKGKASELMNAGYEDVMKQEPLIRKLMNDRMEEQGAPRIYDKPIGYSTLDNIIRAAASYEKGGNIKEVDTAATKTKLEKLFTKKRQTEYEKWLDDLGSGIIEKRGIRNDRDMFTPSGNRRSFEQLYNEYNLQNIVKAMSGEENQKGAGLLGTGNIFGAATKEYASISDIKADSGRLIQEETAEHEAAHDAFAQRFSDITVKMLKEGDKGFGATMDAGDAAVDALIKGKTVSGILRQLKSWHRFNATQEIAQEIYDLAQEISNAPTTYFEAKPRRAVGFDEVAAVVMPRAGSAELKAQLESRGVKVLTYNPGKEGDRLKKINSVDGIKFAKNRRQALDDYIAKYGAIPTGEKPARDILLPNQTADDKYVSRTVRTILEAKATPDEMVPTVEKLVASGDLSFDSYTDEQAMADADSQIQKVGWASSLENWTQAMNKGEVSKANTAMGWALYNNAANSGDTETALFILNKMVGHQRSAAQALQATRILKKLSPETQLYQAQRSIASLQEELNERYGEKGAPELVIDKDLAEAYLKAKEQEERDAILRDIYRDIGRQMPSRFMDKWNAWRYLAMLGNPRTHVRNIVGNAGFAPVVAAKNVTATGIEAMVNFVSRGKTGRTKSIIIGATAKDRALLGAAWEDYAKAEELILAGGKYDDLQRQRKEIEAGRVIFKTKPLEAARRFNSAAMEQEDSWFAKPHYAAAMAGYCKANGITPEQIAKDGAAVKKAREYAVKEAQKATYRDTNALSQVFSDIGGKWVRSENPAKKAVGHLVEGILPFRKTPANILARGLEYSPLGIIKGVSEAVRSVKSEKITPAQAIDSISAGLTGTGLLALGFWLASMGLVRGHGSDDEKERGFEELSGHQSYSMEIGNDSYTLDWLAPECLPFFVGVNLYDLNKGKEETNVSTVLNSMTTLTEPMLEMSCLQSLNDLIDSVGYASSNDLSGLVTIAASAATSYITQAFPTLLGQIERSGEAERMTTYTDKNNRYLTTDMQYTIGKVSAKLPGWDFSQIPYIDAWGRTESSGKVGTRVVNNMLNPSYTSTIVEGEMEEELLRLYMQTDESVFPGRAAKYFNVDGERKDLTAEEYVKYATIKGQTSYEVVSELLKSKAYKGMNDEKKAKAVEDSYTLANQLAKSKISDYAPDSWVLKAMEAKKSYNIPYSTFVAVRAELSDLESLKDADGDTITNSLGLLKMEAIYNMKGLTDKQRQALFEYMGVGKNVIHYNPALVKQKLAVMRKKAQ